MNDKKVTKGLIELIASLLAEEGCYSEDKVRESSALQEKRLSLSRLLAELESGEVPDKSRIYNVLQTIKLGENAYLKISDISLVDKMITYSEVTKNQFDYVNTYHDNSSTVTNITNNHYHSNNSISSPKSYIEKH